MADISALAVVEPGAKLADDVRIGPFAYIGARVRIASGCVIDPSATIVGETMLGSDTHVLPLAVVGTSPGAVQASGRCIIGRDNVIREHVTIQAAPDGATEIGDGNLIMVACLIGPGARIGSHEIFANCTRIGAGARIEDYVRTSGFAVVGDGVHVGAYAFLAGYSSIDRNVPPYAIVQGSPFRVRGPNTENLKRCKFAEADIQALKKAFRQVFNGTGEGPNQKAIRKLLAGKIINPHVRRFTESVRDAAAAAPKDDEGAAP